MIIGLATKFQRQPPATNGRHVSANTIYSNNECNRATGRKQREETTRANRTDRQRQKDFLFAFIFAFHSRKSLLHRHIKHFQFGRLGEIIVKTSLAAVGKFKKG
jgi:hypothetical protein